MSPWQICIKNLTTIPKTIQMDGMQKCAYNKCNTFFKLRKGYPNQMFCCKPCARKARGN